MTVSGMKRLVVGLCLAMFVASPMADTLNMKVFPQKNAFEWCWAASSQAVCSYFDKNFKKTLDEVASVYTTDKSKYPPLEQLATVLPKVVETNGSAINMKTVFKPGRLSWSEYKKEIDEDRPFIFVIKWDVQGIYHCNVAIGYVKDSTQLYYMDPGNEDKRWRSWKEIMGENTIKSGNTKKGTWFGSLLVLPKTAVENGQQPSLKPFSIITSVQSGNGLVTIHFADPLRASSAVSIFDLRGVCVYQTAATEISNVSSLRIPYRFAAGNYVASVVNGTTGTTSREAARSFSIMK